MHDKKMYKLLFLIKEKRVCVCYFTLIDLCLFIFVNISDMYDVKRSSILYPKLVSHNNFDPRTKLPIVIWKYVLPEDQLLILVKGCVTKIS